MALATSPDLEGRQLGDFVIRQRLGQGGFGVVYIADQPMLGRDAVIKILRRPAGGPERAAQRFLREARLASSLDHPYAAHVYAFGAEPDGLLWIAMERVRGVPLDRFLATDGAMQLSAFVPFFERLCEVVHSAHQKGIVHRDIKPANVMVVAHAGRLLPKLLDLGIAKIHDAEQAPADPAQTPIVVVDRAEAGLAETMPGESGAASAVTPISARLTPSGALGSVPSGKLTEYGSVMGSPHYMAPEQWLDPTTTDARADVYALGVLIYECLVGRPPFRGNTLSALAHQHANAAVPPLGAGFPAKLDQVLARAMAKRANDRCASALELAAAMRDAAGLADDLEDLPRLDPLTRDEAIARAPQPLAETLLALDGARNAHAAMHAAAQAAQLVVRWVGMLSLATVSSMAGVELSAEARRALQALGTRQPDDQEWLALASLLLAPHAADAKLRAAAPLPELVDLVAARAPLERLVEARRRAASDGTRDAGAVRGQLIELLGALTDALRSLRDALAGKELVVARGDVLERWSGVRQPVRATLAPASGPAPAPGRPLLVDGARRPVLELWPLVQVACPSPGTAEEMFMFAGPGRHGGRLSSLPAGFERHDDEVWTWLRALGGGDERAAVAAEPERAPYKGLAAFSADDAADYFGRERQVEAFVNRLRVQRILAIVGPSGSGKSSFAQAGVVASLPSGWRAITLRPGPTPCARLDARLAAEGIDLSQGLRPSAAALAAPMRMPAAPSEVLVLLIDQFEELFTLCTDAAERERFAARLIAAAALPDERVRVVLTLRDDFLAPTEALPALGGTIALGLQLLGTPAEADLVRTLTEPARRAGYQFAEPELPREMAHTVAGRAGALPLLSFTAARLWELRDQHFHRLTRSAYDAIGGVAGALALHAEEVLAAMPARDGTRVREAFRQLVTADGTRAVLRTRELAELLGEGGERVIERLVSARLLVVSEGDDGAERVEIVHEALLSAWPRLVTWRQEDADGARLRDQLRAAAAQWHERGRPSGLLWRDDALTDLRRWQAKHGARLTGTEDAFARTSLAAGRRARVARIATIAIGFALLSAISLVLWQAGRQARTHSAATHANLLEQYRDQGRQLLLAGDPMRALPYLAEVYRSGADDAPLRVMIAQATEGLAHDVATLPTIAPLNILALAGDGKLLATGDMEGEIRVWDTASATLLHVLPERDQKGWVETMAFAPDGTTLLSGGQDGVVRIWDARAGQLLAKLELGAGINGVAIAPDGARAVVVDASGTVSLWELARRERLWTAQHEGQILGVAFSPDGTTIATGGSDHTARLWDARSGALLATMQHGDRVQTVRFSPDGRRLATASADHTARLWDVPSGQPALVLADHSAPVSAAEFSPDGKRLATASMDGVLHLWDAASGKAEHAIPAHQGRIRAVAFTPDGRRLVTVSSDRSAKVWDAETGELAATMLGHTDAAWKLAVSPDGTRAYTGSLDRTVKIWSLDGQHPRFAVHAGDRLWHVRASDDGLRFVTGASDGGVRVFSASGEPVTAFTQPAVVYDAALAPDGKWLVTAGGDGLVRAYALDGKLLGEWHGHQGEVRRVRFDRAGTHVITVGEDRTARIWDTSGQLLFTLRGHEGPLWGLDVSPDDQLIATSSDDGTVILWRADDGRELRRIVAHPRPVNSVEFSSDGKRLLTASDDQTAKVWDVETSHLLVSMHGHVDGIETASFGAGDLVLTTGDDRQVWLWDGVRGTHIASLGEHDSIAMGSAFLPGSDRFVTVGLDGMVRIWGARRAGSSTAELDQLIHCRAPFALQAGHLVDAATDPAACVPGPAR